VVKRPEKLARQMRERGWTWEQIDVARRLGRAVPAINFETGGPATRYIHPSTGQSVIVDDTTGDVFHVGAKGYGYGPDDSVRPPSRRGD
jgi:hypothetical protein